MSRKAVINPSDAGQHSITFQERKERAERFLNKECACGAECSDGEGTMDIIVGGEWICRDCR